MVEGCTKYQVPGTKQTQRQEPRNKKPAWRQAGETKGCWAKMPANDLKLVFTTSIFRIGRSALKRNKRLEARAETKTANKQDFLNSRIDV